MPKTYITFHENVQEKAPEGSVYVPKDILSNEILEVLDKNRPDYTRGLIAIKQHHNDTFIYIPNYHDVDGECVDRLDIQRY
jgi:hypothetical protein